MFIPYKNLQISLDKQKREINFSLPWLNIDTTVNKNDLSAVERIIEKYPSNVMEDDFQTFFNSLRGYCIGYDSPRQDLKASALQDNNADLLLDQIKSELKELFPSIFELVCAPISSDIENIIEKATNGNTYDPLTAFGLIKEIGLKHQVYLECEFPIYELLERERKRSEDSFFKAIEIILNQTCCISSTIETILSEGIENGCAIPADFLKEIFDEEKGHKHLIYHALKESGGSLKPDLVFPSTHAILFVLKKAFYFSPLTAALIIDLLEGEDYPESDPLADVLRRSSKPSASLGLDKHFKINKEGNHKDLGYTLAEQLPGLKIEDLILVVFLYNVTLRSIEYTDTSLSNVLS